MEQYDAWALAVLDAVWRACSDNTSFSVRRGQMPLQILLGEPATNLTFPELDPPEHRIRRRVLAPAYTSTPRPREAAVRVISCDVLGPLLDGDGRFDVFGDYAHVVAGRFAATKAGVPLADADRLRRDISASFRREPGPRGTSEANQAAATRSSPTCTSSSRTPAGGRRWRPGCSPSCSGRASTASRCATSRSPPSCTPSW